MEKIFKEGLSAALFFLCLLAAFPAHADNNAARKSYATKAERREAEKILSRMSLRDKVGQMFWIRPEYLLEEIADGTVTPASADEWASYHVTSVTPAMAALYDEYPAGGVILFTHNCTSPQQLRAFVPQIKALKGAPLVCVDEEGGRVSRLAVNDAFKLKKYESMAWLTQNGKKRGVYEAARYIGSYLKEYGFDLDFAPDADVNSNPDNPIIGTRSFSSHPDSAAAMACRYLDGLSASGVIGCLKHFPGHGDTKTDSHLGYAETQKTWEEMKRCETIPFKAGIRHGAEMIMAAHITAPNVDPRDIPSSLSSVLLQDKLRRELGFTNVIVSDAMEMRAISQQYTPEQAAVLSIQAGVDVVLCVNSYKKAFDAVVNAVKAGTISEERINESVRRILTIKIRHTK